MKQNAPATNETTADQSHEVARIAAFSDGVFAIAITLLTLQLELPKGGDLVQDLNDLGPSFLAFVISFLVIGTYWVAHHRLFAVVRGYDGRLIWLNMATLFFIVLLPFTTSVISDYGGSRFGVVVYVASLAGAGLATTALAAYALVGHRLCAPSVSADTARFYIWRGAVVAIYFTASLALLPFGPAVVEYSWFGIPLVTGWLHHRYRMA
jgi:uncharacterized membrane protein